MPDTIRADLQAYAEEIARLREQVASLEREIRRARRCLAAERAGRKALQVRLSDEERASASVIGELCRLFKK